MLRSATRLLDCIFSKECALCKALVSENYCLCEKCWMKLEFISHPYCNRCCMPIDPYAAHIRVCRCFAQNHVYSQIRSIVRYNETAKNLLLKFKNGSDFYAAKLMAKLVNARLKESLEKVDIICPVPLSRAKLILRTFNQTAVILKHLESQNRKKVVVSLLEKVKETRPQSSLSKEERKVNLKGAFKVSEKYIKKGLLHRKTIGLFDDVVTTGSTANECAKILLQAGAKNVIVFSFARA